MNLKEKELAKHLRKETGYGMIQCIKALRSCENDIEKAKQWLYKSNILALEDSHWVPM